MSFRLASLSLLAAAGLYVGCSTSNGDPIPPPDNGAPSLDAGSKTTPKMPDASGPSDAAPEADAPHDAGDPVSQVRISEVYVDDGTDGVTVEFIELRGAPGTPVDELRLRILDADGAVTGEIDVAAQAGDTISGSGFWTVGGGNVSSEVDHVLFGAALNAWGMDTPRGAVQLVRGTGRTLLDVVGYDTDADAGALPQPASSPTQTVEGKPAVLPVISKSFGRTSGAADTNDNRADFCTMTPTPCGANAACD